MENVVPSVLQRLRATDIIRMAGLTVASLGQEYFRQGAVHHTHRQGARLSGIVDVLHAGEVPAASAVYGAEKTFAADGYSSHYPVEVELHTSTSWTSTCPCDSHSSILCMHAAALLYQWLARPSTFSVSSLDSQDAMLENTPYSSNQADNNSDEQTSVSSPVSPTFPIPQLPPPPQASLSHPVLTSLLAESEQVNGVEGGSSSLASLPIASGTDTSLLVDQEQTTGTRMVRPLNAKPLALTRGPAPLATLQEILTQMGLSELRGIAREYAMSVNTPGKQQLVDSILEILKQTDTVRRMANTLEKPPRQLLAALTLAGGSMSDDDLRGVYERFGLGQPGQLQNTLAALQNKGFLFRTSLNSAPQQRIGMSGALLDVGWFVPTEVRNALRVTVPVATLDVERANENGEAYDIRMATPYTLLADLLLVARSLDGFNLDREQEREKEKSGNTSNTGGATNAASATRSSSLTTRHATGQLAPDGSIPLPAPVDMPSATLLATVQKEIDRPQPLLRFATRLIRLADIVHKDDGGTPHLRVLPHVAQLLLGSVHAEVTRDLFELWLTQSPYDDLFDLRNDGLRLRCRATSLSHPMLRISELEAENAEARQAVIALLAQTPFQQWVSFSSFARFVYRLNPLFLQKRQRLFSMPHWWIEYEEGRPLRPTQLNDWLRAEYYYLAHLIRGPLHWWGVCDIAYARDGRLAAFRLTPLARWLLHGDVEAALSEDDTLAQAAESSYDTTAAEDTTIMVTPQDELLVPCTAQAWPLISLLDRFAQTAGVQNGRLCYRLTPAALGAALSNGTSPEPLLAALQQLSVQDKDSGDARDAQERQSTLALTRIIAQLERWIASYGRIRLYTGVALVEVAEAVVMRELQATTSLEEHILHSVQPTLHILKKVGAERLIDELKRRSQSPLLHGEEEYGAE